jgi:RNA polymerase sigma factor (sigma-70 family)
MDPIRASSLLQRYTATRCGASFRELVEGHAGLVYSAALRIAGDSGLAEDVMQTVFAALAANPGAVRDGKGLAAWLHRAASGRAVDAVRTESRRRQREQHATHMNASTSSEPDSLWDAAAPVIDSALSSLSETDRQLLLLRFWQRQDMRCIGQAFGLSDDAAQKRIGRALQKLRAILLRRGITGTASALSVALMASASAAPPAAAVARISAAALALSQTAPSAAAGTFFTNTIAMTTKSKVALTTAAACAAIGAPVYIQQREIQSLREENASLRASVPVRKNVLQAASPAGQAGNSSADATSAVAIADADSAPGTPATEKTRRPSERTFGPAANLDPGGRRATSLGGLDTADTIEFGGLAMAEGDLAHLGGGERTVPMVAGKVHWDHGQATGAPDTHEAGDKPTAWAPKSPRSGEQWLSLGYEKPVEIKEINIHETHSPGAISKVAALMPDGSEKVLWQGTAAKPGAGEDSLETSLPVPAGTTSAQIKVYVDTNRVDSWPEIDAVELVGTNGTRQWANRSSASTSYSENYSSTPVTISGNGDQTIVQGSDGRVLEVRSATTSP